MDDMHDPRTPRDGAEGGTPIRVLFICTHNSARSQMAEGLLRSRGGSRFAAFSAGTEATEVRPLAIRAMDEIGIDIRGQWSKTLVGYLGEPFDLVVTVCDSAREACPVFPGARRTDALELRRPVGRVRVGRGAARRLPTGPRRDRRPR